MQKALNAWGKNSPKHSITRMMSSWCAISLQGGNRRQEWCQTRGSKHLANFQKNLNLEAYAFCKEDITFYGKGGRYITHKQAIKHPSLTLKVQVRYRWQKNGDHYQKKKQVRNFKKPYLCSVTAWIIVGVTCDQEASAVERDTKAPAFQIF